MVAENRRAKHRLRKHLAKRGYKTRSSRRLTARLDSIPLLEASPIPLESLLDAVPVAIYIKNMKTEKVFANQAEAECIGFKKPQEIIGKTDFDLFSFDLASKYYADDLRVLHTGESLIGIEEPITRIDGSTAWIRTTKIPLRDQEGNIIGLIGVNMDVTDRKLAQDALQQYNNELKKWVDELERQKNISDATMKLGYILQSNMIIEDICAKLPAAMEELFLGAAGQIAIFDEQSSYVVSKTTWGKDPCEFCDAIFDDQNQNWIFDNEASFSDDLSGQNQPICIPLRNQDRLFGVFFQHIPFDNSDVSEISTQLHTQQWKQVVNSVAERIGLALANIKLSEQLLAQSIRDPLTNLFNRRYMIETLERELHRVIRSGQMLWLLMIDMDHFKKINDTYGHLFGDLVLCSVAEYLQRNIRIDDVVCRYGGEEFVIILTGLSCRDVMKRAQALRKGIEKLEIQFVDETEEIVKVTISMGIACFPLDASTGRKLLLAADTALYRAKAAGRNRVVFYQDIEEEDVFGE